MVGDGTEREGVNLQNVINIDQAGPVGAQDFSSKCYGEDNFFCLRTGDGPTNRGGYLIRVRVKGDRLVICTRHGIEALVLHSWEEVAEYANHISGRKFSEEMWRRLQDVNVELKAEFEALGKRE